MMFFRQYQLSCLSLFSYLIGDTSTAHSPSPRTTSTSFAHSPSPSSSLGADRKCASALYRPQVRSRYIESPRHVSGQRVPRL